MKEPIWEIWGALVVSDKKCLSVGDYVSLKGSASTWRVLGVSKKGLLILREIYSVEKNGQIKYISDPELIQLKDQYWWIPQKEQKS